MAVTPEHCGTCGEEVRYGGRDGRVGWWHREDVGHNVLFGERVDPEVWALSRDAWHDRHDQEEEEEREDSEQTDPEVLAMPVDLTGKRVFVSCPDGTVAIAQLPGGAKTVVNAARKTGWTIAATYARGPWMHASRWVSTGVADHVLLRLTRGREYLTASWRDNKFEIAWSWDRPGAPLNSADLKARVKEGSAA